MKSGYVTIVGRPNVGKSTLINRFMKEHLAIVSDRPQTTRTSMKAIYNDGDSQIIFVDTPGMHRPKHKLGEFMVGKVREETQGVDVIVFLTEPGKDIGPGDKYIIEMLKNLDGRKILAVNKMDTVKPEEMAETLIAFSEEMHFDEMIPISATTGKNAEVLMDLIKKYLPEGPQYYPPDMMADVQERFIASEAIREKALRLLSEEIPHGIAVEITNMKERDNGILDIEADIITEKESHKPIIIGREGNMLKKIGTYARQDLEHFLGQKVNLKLFVKIRKDWRDNPQILSSLGYKKEK